jgi:restriction system protein
VEKNILSKRHERLSQRIMSLSEEDLKEPLPSGLQKKFDNRVAWARSYFVQAKVLISPRRGYFLITDRGTSTIKT